MAILADLVAGLHAGSVEVIDLSAPLSEDTPIIRLPEDHGQPWAFQREVISRYDAAGETLYWNNIRLSEHTGTHFDAPVHWLSGRELDDVSQLAPRRLRRGHIEAWQGEHGPRTGWDSRCNSPERFLNDGHTPGIAPACARWLAEHTTLVGIDVETVGTDAGLAASFDDRPFPCHWYLCLLAPEARLTQLRNLAKLPPQDALLIASPLPIVGGSGSPARVLALVERS